MSRQAGGGAQFNAAYLADDADDAASRDAASLDDPYRSDFDLPAQLLSDAVDGITGAATVGKGAPDAVKTGVRFDDGVRKIDYILVFIKDNNKEEEKKRSRRRRFFLETLTSRFGLQVESAKAETGEEFVKVHAPFEVLCLRAEMLRLKMPIRLSDDDAIFDDDLIQAEECCCSALLCREAIRRALRRIDAAFDVDPRLVPEERETDYYTLAFDRQNADVFRILDEENFFSSAQRVRLVYDALARAPYQEEEKERKIGIEQLINIGDFSAAFSLHDGEAFNAAIVPAPASPSTGVAASLASDTTLSGVPISDRERLYHTWGNFKYFYKRQPLNLVRKYFGEKVAVYFAWLGFYTRFLFPAALLGLAATAYGVATLESSVASREICDDSVDGNLIMCPQCREPFCPFWKLQNSCFYSKLVHLVDNEFTIVFCFFMSVWSVLFLEFWKRRQARIAYQWDLLEDFEDESNFRPDFEARCRERRRNPVTHVLEPYFPPWARLPRYLSGVAVVVLAVICVLVAIVGVIVYRGAVRVAFWQLRKEATDKEVLQVVEYSKILVTITSATLNLVFIMILNKFYGILALKLTRMENQRTDKDYEDSFTVKMFCFQFVNFYASIFYIAFFKGRFHEFFQDSDELHAVSPARYDACDPAGCLLELFIQMFIIMVGKQIFMNFLEFLQPRIPLIRSWWREWRCRRKSAEVAPVTGDGGVKVETKTRWESDLALTDVGELGLFDEYLEMVIQFGFVTLFVTAFPLAPVFALINNVIEIRLDANKFTKTLRRPRPQLVRNIGAWFAILSSIANLAVITNALVIAFTSNFVESLYFRLTSGGGALVGFTRFSLSEFNATSFTAATRPEGGVEPPNGTCFYRDYRSPSSSSYARTTTWFHVMLAKVVFVLVFEHVVYFVRDALAWVVPDVPDDVRLGLKREAYLGRQALYGKELDGGGRGGRGEGEEEEGKSKSPLERILTNV